jgi:ferredoxin
VKVTIDTEYCVGHGRCYDVAPALFAGDEDGMGIVNGDGSVAADHFYAASAAVRLCPERAVRLSR